MQNTLLRIKFLSLIARIDEFKVAWRAVGTLAPKRLSALRRVATTESIGSSTRIEGSKLTDREVERLLSGSLESVIELHKKSYYLALRQTQGTIRSETPNWQPWLVFLLRLLAEQVGRLEKKVERERIVLAVTPLSSTSGI